MKDTIEMLKLAVALGEKIAEGLEDNDKLDWDELMGMLPTLTLLSSAIEGAKNIPHELANMSYEQRKELFAEIEKLELPNKDHEAIAEQALKSMAEVFKLIMLFKDVKK